MNQVSSSVEIEEDNDDVAVYTPVDGYSTGHDKASIVAELESSEEKRKKKKSRKARVEHILRPYEG